MNGFSPTFGAGYHTLGHTQHKATKHEETECLFGVNEEA